MSLLKNRIYYGPDNTLTNEYELQPIPNISINKEIHYSNSVIIGYIYILNISGTVISEDTSDETNDIPIRISNRSMRKLVDNVETTRKILSRNGSTLNIEDKYNNTIFQAKGGILRSLTFSESPNYWTASVEYTAQIEFNNISLLGQSIVCNTTDIDADSITTCLVDIEDHKIRSFTDSWSFSINANNFNDSIFDTVDISNIEIQVNYSLSAVGKLYFCNELTIPAHEEARKFIQERLYKTVKDLIFSGYSKLFKITHDTFDTACGLGSLSGINCSASGANSLLGTLSYLPYNESISCETSESDGSFSANYTCVLKPNDGVNHTLTKTASKEKTGKDKFNCGISVNGTIQGFVPGGLIYSDGSFSLPQNGSVLVRSSLSQNKIMSASSFFNNKIANGLDLKDDIKDKLGIIYSNLCIKTEDLCDDMPTYPPPASFNLTTNYTDGTINYSAEYTSDRSCKQASETASISVSSDGGTDVIAEFIVPNGNTIIQDLGTKTAKRITINVQGKNGEPKDCCLENTGLSGLIESSSCGGVSLPSGISIPGDVIITQKQISNNLKEGTYNATISYICATACDI